MNKKDSPVDAAGLSFFIPDKETGAKWVGWIIGHWITQPEKTG